MTINSDNKYFKIKEGLWKGNNLWDLYKKAQTPYEWHKVIFLIMQKQLGSNVLAHLSMRQQ